MNFKSKQLRKIFSHTLKSIHNAPRLEEYWRLKLNDPKHIHRYYDRNKACRIAYATAEGKSIGTCVAESQKRFLKTIKRRPIQAIIAIETDERRSGLGIIYHQAIIYYEDGEWRYETYANGIHYNFRVKDKVQIQPWDNFEITWKTSTFKEQKFVEFILTLARVSLVGRSEKNMSVVVKM
tara:strand:- start:5683 stop:6222 length:540 start_codon:yes stop_codon:yes gene_type:complete